MPNYGGDIAAKEASLMANTVGGGVRAFTQRDRINQAIAESEQRLAAAKRAAEILEAHPEIEELLNLLQRF